MPDTRRPIDHFDTDELEQMASLWHRVEDVAPAS